MRKLKLFLSLLMLISFSVGTVWAAKDDVVYKYGGTALGTNNAYQNYANASIASADDGSTLSTASWAATCGSNQSQKLWLGANNNNKAKMILSTGSYSEASGIASAIGVNTSDTYYAALIGRTNFDNVYKVTLEYSTPGGTAPSEAWILYSTDNGSTWTVGKKMTSLSASGTNFELGETIESARYAFVIHSTGYCQFKVPILTFYEGSTSSCSKTVTITKGAETNGTYTLSATEVCGDGEGEDVSISAITPAPGYAFDEITTSASGTVDNVNKKVTGITANTTITVKFKELQKFTVTWNVNGDESTTTQVEEGAKPVFPATPAACDATSTTFIGWATEPWSGKLENLAGKTVYTSADAMPAVSGAVTYYAVFAKSSGAAGKLFDWAGGASADFMALDGVELSADSKDYAAENAPYLIKWNGTGKYAIISVDSQPGKVSFGVKMIGGASSSTVTVQESTAANGTFTDVETLTISGSTNDVVNLESTKAFKSTTRAIKLYYTKGSNVGLGPISIDGAVSMSDYMTTCCTGHDINIAKNIEYGTVTADPTSACEGATITLTATPDAHCQFVSWSVNSGAVTVTDNQFEMPDGDVTVSATFEEIRNAVNVSDPEHGTINVTGAENLPSVLEGTVLDVAVTGSGYKFTLKAYKDGDETTIVPITDGKLTMPAYAIVITAEEEKLVSPTILVNKSVIDFGTAVKAAAAPAAETFTISGANLTGDLSLAWDESDAYFAWEVTDGSLTATAGVVAATISVSVTAKGMSTAGTLVDNLVVSGGGADPQEVMVGIEVQETYTAKWYLNGEELTENTQVAIAGTDLEIPSNPTKLAEACSAMVFRGWASAPIVGRLDAAPAYANLEGIKMADHDTAFYAVFAEAEAGDPDWVEITEVPTAGTYAICSSDYFMKASVNSNRFENGAEPSITDGKLDAAPASNCQWEVSINESGKFLFKNGSNYAAGNGTKNQGALVTDASSYAQWDISYSGGFVIENVGNKADEVNYTLRQNGTYGWAAYGSDTGNAPRLFKSTPTVNYTDFCTTCKPCAEVTLTKAIVGEGTLELSATTVKTCKVGEVTVTATPADGYTLTSVTISELEGASISGNTISLAVDTEGELKVTATFTAIDYEVAVSQTGDAGATLTGATDKAHVGNEITVTTSAVDGYYFIGWEATGVELTDVSALSQTFDMPAGDVSLVAKYAKIYTTAEALTLEKGSENVYVAGYVISAYKSYSRSWYISDDATETNKFICYTGNATTTAAIQLGDKVLVCGTIGEYESVKQLASGYDLVSRVALSEITMDASKAATAYDANAAFEREKVTVKATWDDATEKDVTDLVSWNTTAAPAVKSNNVYLKATWCDKNAEENIAVTINSIASIEALVAADLASETNVTVSFLNVGITGIGTGRHNIYTDVDDENGRKVIIYHATETAPETWLEGGKLSGTISGQWKSFESNEKTRWEIVPTTENWEFSELSYTKPEAPISWPNAEAVAYTVGKENTWQVLSNEKGLAVVYSATGVATVNESTGAITALSGAGDAVITATYTEDAYLGKEVSYTLHVYAPTKIEISGSLLKTEYEAGDEFYRNGLIATATYGDESQAVVTSLAAWSNDLQYGLVKADGKVNVTAEWQELSDTQQYDVTVTKHYFSFAGAENGDLIFMVGTDEVDGSEGFAKGTVVTVGAKPATNFHLVTLTADGEDISSSLQFEIGTKGSAIVIEATFEKDATALDNTEASEKVVKTMENGVLIIRRGDKTYNGQGQLIK